METKDYAKMFRNIKEGILNEIRSLVPVNNTHSFKKDVLVRYCEGETALVEYCLGVKVSAENNVSFIVQDYDGERDCEPVTDEAIYQYDDDSFVAILSHLKKEIREKKLSHLRDIVAKSGNKISFDGYFWYKPSLDGEVYDTKLIGLSLNSERVLAIENITKGEIFSDSENTIPDDELDRIIDYVESHTKRKFVVRVSGSYSRTFEIEAANFEEALEFAKTEWKEDAPLCPDDSNGEDWEDYTSVAH